MRIANAPDTIRLTNGQRAYTGTITRGTLRDVDVIPALLTWLACHDTKAHDKIMQSIVDRGDIELQALCCAYENNAADYDSIVDLYEAIFSAMDNLMPEGWVFSCHPGDGSDFGIWTESLLDD